MDDGKLAEPRPRNTQEELDELEAMFPPKKSNKRRQKLIDSLAKEDGS